MVPAAVDAPSGPGPFPDSATKRSRPPRVEQHPTAARCAIAAAVNTALAANESSPPRVLTRLTVENPRGCRRRIAANPSASPRLLPELAQDNDFEVRKRVAASLSCPRSVLGWLRHDTSKQVTEAAARR